MTELKKQKLTLDRPELYQIKVPGEIKEGWLDWNGGMKSIVERDNNGDVTTVLTLTVDQAALQGLLKHLYSLGLPLISATWIDHTEI